MPVPYHRAREYLSELGESGKLVVFDQPFQTTYEEVFGESLLSAAAKGAFYRVVATDSHRRASPAGSCR